jgi:hypothetical protein
MHRVQYGDLLEEFFIDDTGVEIDNRDSGETWLTYEDLPRVRFRISIEFVRALLKNAEENNPGWDKIEGGEERG